MLSTNLYKFQRQSAIIIIIIIIIIIRQSVTTKYHKPNMPILVLIILQVVCSSIKVPILFNIKVC